MHMNREKGSNGTGEHKKNWFPAKILSHGSDTVERFFSCTLEVIQLYVSGLE
uniref:Uncharacterized protein n=1 Tax=Anguilla anguilla TaxID=7936 RepID=A0A0E9UQG3_ANGAN